MPSMHLDMSPSRYEDEEEEHTHPSIRYEEVQKELDAYKALQQKPAMTPLPIPDDQIALLAQTPRPKMPQEDIGWLQNKLLELQGTVMREREEKRQLALATLIVNARLVAYKYGERRRIEPIPFTSPIEIGLDPLVYRDALVEIVMSQKSRALRIRWKGQPKPVVEMNWDGSTNSVAVDFEECRAHVRALETRLVLDGQKIT